jgi:hypothetical protein
MEMLLRHGELSWVSCQLHALVKYNAICDSCGPRTVQFEAELHRIWSREICHLSLQVSYEENKWDLRSSHRWLRRVLSSEI